jgi:DNA-binding NarL/FixJ family response regulator
MNSPAPIRIAVVEDQYFFRLALRTTIDARQDMRIAAETGKGSEALALCQIHKPDVLILDLRLPDLSGFEVIRQVHQRLPEIGILVLSNYEGSEDVRRALSAGALAYLTKDASAEMLVEAILKVRAKQRYVTPAIGALLAAGISAVELTAREQEVLRLLACGLCNREIGERLGISENTVRIHVSRILDKLGAGDRTQAVVVAMERGLLHE